MRIAVIGWGSLIWDPRDLQIKDKWHSDGPMLPVEFARVSSEDRLTLVLVDTVALQPTLWVLSGKPTLAEAVRNLAKREGTTDSNIGRWSSTDEQINFQVQVRTLIGQWAQERKLDAVVWTALGPKKPNGENGLATEDELIEYLRTLVEGRKALAAKEYIEKAPTQIKTLLRMRIQREFGWSDMSHSSSK